MLTKCHEDRELVLAFAVGPACCGDAVCLWSVRVNPKTKVYHKIKTNHVPNEFVWKVRSSGCFVHASRLVSFVRLIFCNSSQSESTVILHQFVHV